MTSGDDTNPSCLLERNPTLSLKNRASSKKELGASAKDCWSSVKESDGSAKDRELGKVAGGLLKTLRREILRLWMTVCSAIYPN